MKQLELSKRRELKRQVDIASFAELKEDLVKDLAMTAEYNDALAAAQEIWAGQVQSYKRNRHIKGLAKVDMVMQKRLWICELSSSFLEVPQHYGRFRSQAEEDQMDVQPDRKFMSVLMS